MRVVLEVASGPREGHKVLVRNGQSVLVGRSWLTDLCFEHDARMSSRHFTIHADACVCHIQDQSDHGTFVNDRQIRAATLQPDDRIRAGETLFVARIEGADPNVDMVEAVPLVPSSVVAGGAFTINRYRSGLACRRGSATEMPPAVLAERLSRLYGEILIVDVTNLNAETREHWTGSQYLFDWLPEGKRGGASPLLFSDGGGPERKVAIDTTWGKDALVFVYATRDVALPLRQVRRCAGAFVRPSLLRPQLGESAPECARDLMLGIEAVLVEDESSDSWLLFSAEASDDLSRQLGPGQAMN